MSHNVFANNNEVSCKASSGKTICNTPDVCFTPPLTPATPPGVPVPYPNTGMASDTSEGSATVKISNQEVMLKNKSCFSRSSGDEAGSAPKKGVVTSKNMGKVYFNAWSMDVKVEGENVPRNLDITTNNHMSKMPGNTPPMPHMSSMAVGMGTPKCEACAAAAARAGNPVNSLRGTKLLDGFEDLDFILDGPLELVWQRVYMSGSARIGFFGQGWMTPVEMQLLITRGRVVFVDRDAREIPFTSMAVGESYFHRQEMCTLKRMSFNTYQIRQSDGLQLTFKMAADMGHEDYRPALLVCISDPNDNAIRLEWSAQGELQRIHGSGEDSLLFEWSAGRVTRILKICFNGSMPTQGISTAADGLPCAVGVYEYADGDLLSVTTRGGRRIREFAWTNHIMVQHAQPGGLACCYEWTEHSPAGKVLRSWTNTGSELRFDYQHGRTVVTDQDGVVEIYGADPDGHWIGFTDGSGAEYRRILDEDGHLLGVVAPSGAATRTEFDEKGLPVRFWDEAGAVAETVWHPLLGLPVEERDPLGRAERYAYDVRGNMLSHTSADGVQTLFEYDSRGLVIAITDALGKRGVLEYDRSARLTQVTDCTGSSECFEYDEHSQLMAHVDGVGNRTTYEYSIEGDLVVVTTPDGAVTRYEYDGLGRLVREIEPMGGCTTFHLRADGMLMEVVEPNGQSTRYTRDSVGRLLRIDNPNGASFNLSYDALGSIATIKTFEGTEQVFTYSVDGMLVKSEETATTGQKICTNYAYDPVGRLTRVSTSDGDWAEFEYDTAGQLVIGRNQHVLVSIQYDDAGRRVSESIRRASGSLSVKSAPSIHSLCRFEYAYDANGNVVRTLIPGIMEISFLRYGSGYTHQVLVDEVPYCDIERDPEHMPSVVTQGALVSHLQYDGAWRLTALNCLPAASDRVAGDGVQPLNSLFTYDRNGDLLASRHRGPWGSDIREFRYDASRRVTEKIDNRTMKQTIHWDGASNPVDAPGMTVNDNRVVAFHGVSAKYDGFGRLSERCTPSGRMHLEWNSMHQLVSVEARGRGVAHHEQYVYDAFGRRVTKFTNGQEVTFLWEGERLLMEERGQERRVFLYHDDDREPLGYVLATASGAPADGHRFFYTHNEPLGSPFALTDEEGEVLWRAVLDAFGPHGQDIEPRSSQRPDGDMSSGIPPAGLQPLRMLGQYYDAATGLCYNRFRYYDPLLGRFISPDPIGLLGGENTYRYAPNVFSWTDPLGLKRIQNAIDGARREAAEAKAVVRGKSHLRVERECYLRSCITGKRMRDPTTKEFRRLDIVVIDKVKGSVTRAIEVTSQTAPKEDQIAKERRIRNRGGQCIRDRITGNLKRVPRVSSVVRRR